MARNMKCDCCGQTAEVHTQPEAFDRALGVEMKEVSPTVFICADGSRRHLPPNWWIFELSTFGDQHIVADLCPECAKKFAAYLKRTKGALAKKTRALSPSFEPKSLPATRKKKRS